MTGPGEWRRTIAANIRAERARAGRSQDDIAEQMRELGFPAWRRSTVSLAEQGKRRVACDEAIGIAWILKTDISTLLCAP